MFELIRGLGQRKQGLIRTHHTHPAVCARARRFFGSWASATVAAGVDYHLTIQRVRQRFLRTRQSEKGATCQHVHGPSSRRSPR